MDFKKIEKINNVDFYLDTNLEKYTTIKLANKGNLAICKTKSSLQELILLLKDENFPYHIVGWGANQVLLNTDRTIFIKLDFSLDKSIFKQANEKYTLPASTPLNILTSHAMKFGLKGWEVFTGIPASLGGAICMNAGTSLGEIGDLIESVEILQNNGDICIRGVDKESFDYRNNKFLRPGEIIVGATIRHNGIDEKIKGQIKEYLEYRKSTQPLTTKNCGSVFKNYNTNIRAGATIDRIGLKAFGGKNLSVSQKHANFIENHGGATAQDFNELVECLKIDIERYTGLEFELEVKVY